MANFNTPLPVDKEGEDLDQNQEDKQDNKKSDYVADIFNSSRLSGNLSEFIKPKIETPAPTPVERESVSEKVPDNTPSTTESEAFRPQTTPQTTAQPQPTAQPVAKDAETREIEDILSEGLDDVYRNLDPQAKQRFRIKGEEAANLIKQMAHSVKFTFKWLIGVLTSWLLTIPKVNKFFLEQEAKIKADRLINWKENKK